MSRHARHASALSPCHIIEAGCKNNNPYFNHIEAGVCVSECVALSPGETTHHVVHACLMHDV